MDYLIKNQKELPDLLKIYCNDIGVIEINDLKKINIFDMLYFNVPLNEVVEMQEEINKLLVKLMENQISKQIEDNKANSEEDIANKKKEDDTIEKMKLMKKVSSNLNFAMEDIVSKGRGFHSICVFGDKIHLKYISHLRTYSFESNSYIDILKIEECRSFVNYCNLLDYFLTCDISLKILYRCLLYSKSGPFPIVVAVEKWSTIFV